jgi:hypothetical protein
VQDTPNVNIKHKWETMYGLSNWTNKFDFMT